MGGSKKCYTMFIRGSMKNSETKLNIVYSELILSDENTYNAVHEFLSLNFRCSFDKIMPVQM